MKTEELQDLLSGLSGSVDSLKEKLEDVATEIEKISDSIEAYDESQVVAEAITTDNVKDIVHTIINTAHLNEVAESLYSELKYWKEYQR